MCLQLLDDFLFVFGGIPLFEEFIEVVVMPLHRFAGVIADGFCHQPILAVILGAFQHWLHAAAFDVIFLARLWRWWVNNDAIVGYWVSAVGFIGVYCAITFVFRHVDFNRGAIKVLVGKVLGSALEVDNGEPAFAVLFVDACAAPDHLLEFGHGLDTLIQHDQLAGFGIHARGHQL